MAGAAQVRLYNLHLYTILINTVIFTLSSRQSLPRRGSGPNLPPQPILLYSINMSAVSSPPGNNTRNSSTL